MKFFFISLIFLTVSCGKSSKNNELVKSIDRVVDDKCQDKLDAKVIIDDLYWYDFSDASNYTEYLNSKTVGQLYIPTTRSRCTAFIVNKNTIMTNNHCVGSSISANGVKLKIRDLGSDPISYTCSKFIMTDRVLDFTLLECNENIGDIYGVNVLSNKSTSFDDQIYVIQENCDYNSDPYCSVNKMIATGSIEQTGKYIIGHNADTLGGSSGSPIYNATTNEVIAIHNAGSVTNARNYGVPMDKIIEKISTTLPALKIHKKREQNPDIDGPCK